MTDLFEPGLTSTSLDLRRMQREVRRRERRWRTLMATAVGLVILALGASISWNFLQAFKSDGNEIPDYPGAGQGQVQVIIEQGDSGADIAQTLYDAGVIASTEAFVNETYANPDDARSIAPGYYVLQREMKAEYALRALLDRENRLETRITIPEGKTVAWILEKVASSTDSTLEEVQAIADDTEALGLPAEAKGSLEGWLFPATYSFNPNPDPRDVLSTMVSKTLSVLQANDVPENQWLKILTIASLVEKEASRDVDRPVVAGVIYNRLDAGMALELDSTVHYVVGNETGSVFTTADDRKVDSPYNTYRYPGLPPGPIGSPGEESIKAAIDPDHNNYFFFTTVNLLTGETKFAETYSEHLKHNQELKQWIKETGYGS